jgi:pyruvate dehydrogenase E2 component (dihydrolipoamide acetyltransferase)
VAAGGTGDAGAAPPATPEPAAPAPASAPTPAASAADGTSLADQINGRIKATPHARRRATELGIDLAQVMPSGPAGEIRLEDVEAIAAQERGDGVRISPLARREARAAGLDVAAVSGSGPGGRILKRDVAEQAAAQARGAGGALPAAQTPVDAQAGDSRTPIRGMRAVIAERMTESHLTMPPVTLNATVTMDRLLALRAELNASAADGGGMKFSINDFILLATARAVRQCPWMRVSLATNGSGPELVQREAVNLGMAVALEQGVVVPVIHHADTLTLTAIAERARDLGSRARARKLDVADMQGGTFTVTNLGMYGITTFTPIINPPEAAILGVGGIRQEVQLSADGAVVARQRLDLSLTTDHRVIDGAQGALFLQALTALLETPTRMLV